ncbi:uncharacterized protein LOC110095330 isoform X3 [Dendrobium catenatum]|uniref:uncharacterized protein LOC110095330 isoform X3 n=1 Tax=Dendrobium catenatum TaxID=906689 RepID=UPI00109FF9A9|nr:uncharacterized protein LOC110095330 isoform X3 [Dendrobium catenatum]
MRARVVVFPIKERNWCFSRSLDPAAALESSSAPQQLRDLFRNITSTRRSVPENAEIVVDFVSEKMNRAWVTLEKAPEATLKSKLHSLGLWLLSRVKPSEVFLKSVSKDVTEVEITYPASLNPRLVRRRLRHIAMRGSAIHRKHLYGSVTLLPLTSVLTGSERLLLLVSDCSRTWSSIASNEEGNGSKDESDHGAKATPKSPWVSLLR